MVSFVSDESLMFVNIKCGLFCVFGVGMMMECMWAVLEVIMLFIEFFSVM